MTNITLYFSYIDTCKYDPNDVNISCKHVKNTAESTKKKATALEIQASVLNSLRISSELKRTLWNLYNESQATVPMVQRINRNVFVVRCDVSLMFPAGLLHVIFNMHPKDSKDTSYTCSCKTDNCEHFLLVFAALLSDPTLKSEFKKNIAIHNDLIGPMNCFNDLQVSIQLTHATISRNIHDLFSFLVYIDFIY